MLPATEVARPDQTDHDALTGRGRVGRGRLVTRGKQGCAEDRPQSTGGLSHKVTAIQLPGSVHGCPPGVISRNIDVGAVRVHPKYEEMEADGSLATCIQLWTCGAPRKNQTNAGPSRRQLSH